jgi:DNA-directed RNA polymerase II subunit RPB2
MTSPLSDEDLSRQVLTSYFDTHGTVRHQIESYDHFLDVLLQRIILESSDVTTDLKGECHKLTFDKVCIPPPTTRESDGFVRSVAGPAEAVARNLTYSSAVLVDVVYTVTNIDTGEVVQKDIYREVSLCKIPMMVRSRYCYLSHRPGDMSSCIFDSGGYFVINGLEKTVIAMQKLRTNTAFVWAGRSPSRALLQCEVRSCNENKLRSTSTLSLFLMPGDCNRPPRIDVALPFLETHVTLTALFKILGCNEIDDMVRVCTAKSGTHDDKLCELARSILAESMESETKEELLVRIGREGTTETTHAKQQRYLDHIISSECLPHMGLTNAEHVQQAKVMYMGHMVHRMLLVHTGRRPLDNRDHLANKRCDATGHLMSLLFRQLFRAYLKGLHMQFTKSLTSSHKQLNIPRIVAARKITGGFKYAFATGKWGVQARTSTSQSGVVQVMNRNSSFASLADKRRVSCPAARDSKNAGIRMLDESAYGLICPAESPEGASCGLVVNLAALAHVRIHACDQETFLRIMQALPPDMRFVEQGDSERHGYQGARVFHNGYLHGFVPRTTAARFCAALRRLRAVNTLPFDASISFNGEASEIHVGTDAGCLCRPLIDAARMDEINAIVEDARASRTALWPALVASGIVVYVDMRYGDVREPGHGYTHVEVHPAAMFGMSASAIPFADHNQAPRNVYQCAMGKQAIGVFASNANTQMHAVSYSLWYPQRPLIGTWLDDVVGSKWIPSGTNMILAIACYGGYNQEDAFIVNEAALQRGMGRNAVSRTVKDEINGDGYSFTRPPDDCTARRAGRHDLLREDGTVPVGTRVTQGDVVIGKVRESDPKSEDTRVSDCSSVVRCNRPCTVDRVLKTTKNDGHALYKVRLRDTRVAGVGDKFTSRHGQKGVIGAVLPASSMPFTEDGLIPDIIMNPHALPSRMTIGMLMEMLSAMLCCHVGRFGDGTAFCGTTVEQLSAALVAAGADPMAEHVMYNGTTGGRLEAKIFMAPVQIQSLKHMVWDKVHARATGPVHHITRQPTEGRRQDGGLRFGEMERDCLVAHGASALLHERLFLQSDPYKSHVCSRCGMMAEGPCQTKSIRAQHAYCRKCDTSDTVREIPMPYATKLFVQEVAAMNMGMCMNFT